MYAELSEGREIDLKSGESADMPITISMTRSHDGAQTAAVESGVTCQVDPPLPAALPGAPMTTLCRTSR